MDARDTLIAYLNDAYEAAGRMKTKLLRSLGLPQSMRSSLTRALDPVEPCLPVGDLVCRWIDALGLRIVKSVPPKVAGIGTVREIRLVEPGDLLGTPEDWPPRGVLSLPVSDLDVHVLEPRALAAVPVRRGMPPTIVPGDLIIVVAGNGPRSMKLDGAVHVVDLGDWPQLRRIQRGADGWILASDTPGIVPVTFPYDADWPCDILARVVAVLHYDE